MARIRARSGVTKGAEIAEKQAEIVPTVEQRLRRKFGLGDQPAKRIALYKQLQAIVDRHGRDAEDVIGEAVAESVGTNHPDRYFCKSIKLKMRERGFSGAASTSAEW